MKLTREELEFLSIWAREEWEPACYQLPCHRLQMNHGVSAAQIVVFIKAWTAGEGKKDLDILEAATNAQPRWPWTTSEEFGARLREANGWWSEGSGKKRALGLGDRGDMLGTQADPVKGL